MKNVKVTYLAHSGFVIEFADLALIFDYYKGKLPESLAGKKLFVFASHFHQDHYVREILNWKEQYPVTYILSRDIRISRDLREKMDLLQVRPRKDYQIDELEIKTLRSTDVGVAFFVRIRGLNIYHAGDLNWWRWEEESRQFNERMEKNFKFEIDQLKSFLEEQREKLGGKIDLAFLPLDYRQEKDYNLGFHYFMQTIAVDYAFPMHMWGVYKSVDQLLNDPCSEPYRDHIIKLSKRGEVICL